MGVTIEIRGLDAIIKNIKPGLVTSALVPAINRATAQARTAGIRETTKRYTLKAKTVREKTAIRKASRSRLASSIIIKSYRMSLLRYSTRQVRKGLSVNVKQSTGRKLIKSGFIATANTGRSAFIRERSPGGKRLVGRLPIRALTGPAVPQLMGSRDVIASIRNTANTTLEKRFNYELGRRWTR